MSQDLEKLYKAVSSRFDIGTFDEFSSKMQTTDDRKRFYDAVAGKGLDLGDYQQYESRLSSKKKEDTSEFSLDPNSTDGSTSAPEPSSTGVAGEIQPQTSLDKKKAANNFAKRIGEELPYPEVTDETPAWAPEAEESDFTVHVQKNKDNIEEADKGLAARAKEQYDNTRLKDEIEDESDDFFRNTDAFLSRFKEGVGNLVSSGIGAAGGAVLYNAPELGTKLLDVATAMSEGIDDERAIKTAAVFRDANESTEDAYSKANTGLVELWEEDKVDAIKAAGLAIAESIPYTLAIGASGGAGAMVATGTALGYGGTVAEEYARDKDVDGFDQIQSIATGAVEGVLNVALGGAERSAGNLLKKAFKSGMPKQQIKDLLMSTFKKTSKSAVGEAAEEAIQGVAGYYIGSLDGDYTFDAEQAKNIAIESAVVGMGSGGMMTWGSSMAANRALRTSEPALNDAITSLKKELEVQTDPESKLSKRLVAKLNELQGQQRKLYIDKVGQMSRLSEDTQIKAGQLALEINELELAETQAINNDVKEQLKADRVEKEKQFNDLVNDNSKQSPRYGESTTESDQAESKAEAADGETRTGDDSGDSGLGDGDNTINRGATGAKGAAKEASDVVQGQVRSGEVLSGDEKSSGQLDGEGGKSGAERKADPKRVAAAKEKRKRVLAIASNAKATRVVDAKNKSNDKEVNRVVSAIRGMKNEAGDAPALIVTDTQEDFNAVMNEEISTSQKREVLDTDGNVAVEGYYDPDSNTIVINNSSQMDDNTLFHEAIHPVLNDFLTSDDKRLNQLVNDAIQNDREGIFNPEVLSEGDLQLDQGKAVSEQKYSPLEQFMTLYSKGEQKKEGAVEGFSRAVRTSMESDNKTWRDQAMLFIDRLLVAVGLDRDVVIKSDDDYVTIAAKLQDAFETGRRIKVKDGEVKSKKKGDFKKEPYKQSDFTSITDGKRFAEAQKKAINKRTEDKLQVDILTPKEAQSILENGGKLFISEDNSAGAYVKGDGYMGGLFKDPKSTKVKASKALQEVRIKEGGKFFDAFATHLEDIYIKNGFRPVARMTFNPDFAPKGWEDSNLKSKPDNTFFVYDPEGDYKKGDGIRIEDYEEAYNFAKNYMPNKQPLAATKGDFKKSNPKTGEQNAEFFTGKALEASSKVPYKPVLDVDQTTKVAKDYQKFTDGGNFTGHISKMIAGFAEKQMKVAEAITKLDVDSFLDIGTSEGGLPKTVAASRPDMRVVGIDPNPTMKANFDKIPGGKNVEYRMEALGASWTETDPATGKEVEIKEFKPKQKFDVINEDYVFQFISNDRKGQVADVKNVLAPNGVFVTSEKFFTKNYDQNEAKKADHQKKYFSEADRAKDTEEIIVGMSDDMVKDTDYYNILTDNFKHIHEFWNSGNFKGFIASDDLGKIQSMIDTMGDLSSEFTDAGSETKGNVTTETIIDPKDAKDGDVLAAGTANFKKKFTKSKFVNNEKLTNLPVKDINEILKSTDGRFVIINSDPTGTDGVNLYGGVGYQAFEKNRKDNIGFAASSISRVSNFQKVVNRIAPNGEPVATFIMIQKPDSMFGNAQAAEFFVDKVHEIAAVRGNSSKVKESLLKIANLTPYKNGLTKKIKGQPDDNSDHKKLISLIKNIKAGDVNSIDPVFDFLGDKSFFLRGGFIKSIFPEKGKKAARSKNWLRAELQARGIEQQDVYNLIGEKDFINKDWGFITSGFITDNSIDATTDEFQSKGIEHPMFNAKFYGKDAFILDGMYDVNENFNEFQFENSKQGVKGNVSQSFYVGGQKKKVDSKPIAEPESILEFTGRSQGNFKKALKGKKKAAYDPKAEKRATEVYMTTQAYQADQEMKEQAKVDKKKAKEDALFDLKKSSWWDNMGTEIRERLQDQNVRLLKFQEQIRKQLGRTIEDAEDVYTKLELLKSKTVFQIKALNWKITSPQNKNSLFSRLIKAGLDPETLGKFMAAIHAPERNASIRNMNLDRFKDAEKRLKSWEKKLAEYDGDDGNRVEFLESQVLKAKENLSNVSRKVVKDHGGMTNEEAEEFLSSLSDKDRDAYAEFAAEYRAEVTEPILKMKRDYGLISEEAFEEMNKFEYYVPMKVDQFAIADRVAENVGKGVKRRTYAIKGTDKYGFTERTNPVYQGLNEMTATIIESEKNEAFGALYELAKNHPTKMFKVHSAHVESRRIKGINKIVDLTDDRVKDKSIKVFVDGKGKYIEINDPKLRQALKDPRQALDFIPRIKLLSGFAKWFRISNTMYNPEFLISNLVRDLQNAMISANLEVDKKSAFFTAGGILKRVAQSGAAVRRARANNDYSGKYGQAFLELESLGGITSFWSEPDMKQQIADMKKSMSKNGEIKSSKLKDIGRHIDAVSDSVELSTRLATYMMARDAGLSKQKAAALAKNVTVNFDKKGTYGQFLNTLYLFSNAGIQGSWRAMTALARSGKVRAIAATLVALGASEGLLFGLMDEEELYDKIPEWIKERNLIIPAPFLERGYITIPLPYGFNVFKYMGNNAVAFAERQRKGYGGKTAGEAMGDMTSAALGAFNPFHSATFKQAVAPTILDPVVQHLENKTFFDTDLAPKNYDGRIRVESEEFYESTPQIWIDIAQRLNNWTNFDKDNKIKGKMDWSPEVYENYFGGYGGGLVRFTQRSINLAGNMGVYDKPLALIDKEYDKKPIRLSDIPMARKLISELPEGSRFNYGRIDSILDRSKVERISDEEDDYFWDLIDEAYDAGVKPKFVTSMIREYVRNQAELEQKLN